MGEALPDDELYFIGGPLADDSKMLPFRGDLPDELMFQHVDDTWVLRLAPCLGTIIFYNRIADSSTYEFDCRVNWGG